MTELKNDSLIKALFRETPARRPIWMMRQAGRYLPEYREIRSQVSDFITFCQNVDLAAQATLQPLARFDLDAAIIFSDILVVPYAMGMDLTFVPGEGPLIRNPIRNEVDVAALSLPPAEESIGYTLQAMEKVKAELAGRVPLIGFAGSPWTVASYMVEGGSSKVFKQIKAMLYRNPSCLHALLEKVTQMTINYLTAQVASGADVLMLFDSWGGVLTEPAYQRFSLAYMQKIINAVPRQRGDQKIPIILFTKQGGQWLAQQADTGCDALGLDWTVDFEQAFARVGDRVALQGNLDPMALFGSPTTIKAEVDRIIHAVGSHPGHVFNLGHGIDKETPIEAVQCLIEAVRAHD